MAASVIDGMTICSALDHQFGHGYKPLTDQKMASFRSEFEELKMIIIDTIKYEANKGQIEHSFILDNEMS